MTTLMRTIWKFPFDFIRPTLELPSGSEVLQIAQQGEDWFLWAMVNPDAAMTKHQFRVFGTGHPIDQARMRYVTTLHDGPFVWHVFFLGED